MRNSNYTFLSTQNYLQSLPIKEVQGLGVCYRFHFNGKEIDNEGMGGGGSTYDYGFRIYNAQLGKFLSVDPLTKSYPWYTPYQFAGNKPIEAIDLDGLEEYLVIRWYDNQKLSSTTIIKVPDKFANAALTGTIYVELNKNNAADVQFYKQFTNGTESTESNMNWSSIIKNKSDIIVGNYENQNRPYEQELIDWRESVGSPIIASGDIPGKSAVSLNMPVQQPTTVLFEVGSCALDEVNKADLKKVNTMLTICPSLTATVTGNTDSDDSDNNNNNLGQCRAVSVKNFIQNNVSPDKIMVDTKGENAPKQPNNTEAGKAQNRNAEVKINYPQIGQ